MTATGRYRVRIGAPCYRMQLHADHAIMLGELGQMTGIPFDELGLEARSALSLEIEGWAYMHTSLLAPGRAAILAAAIESDADALLSIDSDTWADAPVIARALAIAAEIAEPWAILGLLVPQDDGRVNAWQAEGQRLGRPLPWIPAPAWAVGAAITIHNLHWHRMIRSQAGGERWPWTSYGTIPTGIPGAFVGEDAWHCEAVRSKGGRVLALWSAGGTYHAGFVQGVKMGKAKP